MATAQNMPRISERFRGWPRYRDHMAAADPELYLVQEHAIQSFLIELDQRYGGVRGWAGSAAFLTRCSACSQTGWSSSGGFASPEVLAAIDGPARSS